MLYRPGSDAIILTYVKTPPERYLLGSKPELRYPEGGDGL